MTPAEEALWLVHDVRLAAGEVAEHTPRHAKEETR